ncbi:MAG TPA: thioredoxin domain-containing protein [Bacteroidota bacterium]
MSKPWKPRIIGATVLIVSAAAGFYSAFPTAAGPGGIARQTTARDSLSPSIRRHLKEGKNPNRLIHEKSPYLLQHAFNPVDWYPWGDEAFEKARREDKPIFLSVGYSTCYWCHVMEREVFEDTAIARLMNEKLVCIKVDREERPDIDRVYMTAVQAMTGGGGWPMSVFMGADRTPFFGATYIPPTPQHGRPGFPELVQRISHLWETDRSRILESSKQIGEYLRSSVSGSSSPVGESALHAGFESIAQGYDSGNGGFGSGPKFPRPVVFDFLLRYYRLTGKDSALGMVLTTLRKMADGGVHDHVGGGFHRYSVDGEWRVPHFEKMLYDQAGIAISCLEAFQITHDETYSSVARDVLDYVAGNLTGGEGGFYSAEDAESAPDPSKPDSKEEGAFYLWTSGEIGNLLGKENEAIFKYHYGVLDSGNAPEDPLHAFTNRNILYAAHTIAETGSKFGKEPREVSLLLSRMRATLSAARSKRPRPQLDDKVITAWNGMMISAFSKAYQVLHDEKDLALAGRAADFAMSKLYDGKTGTLRRRYRDGEARFEGTLQDYAFLVRGLLDLYEASFDMRWFRSAITLTDKQNELFWDSDRGGYFDGSGKDPTVLIRTREDYDGAEPSGNSIAALNLLRLAQMTDSKDLRSRAEKTIAAFGARIRATPEALPEMLVALDWSLATPKEIVIAGDWGGEETKRLLAEVHSHFVPVRVLLLADGGTDQRELASYLPFISGIKPEPGKATAYICENYACQLPSSDPAVVSRLLEHPLGVHK